MTKHAVVPHEQWLEARTALLQREKEFNKERDELSRLRRELPWEKVEKNYCFDTSTGPASLSELFEGRGQLMIYHFMYGADWEAGCKGCSFWSDHFDGSMVHLNHRDVTLVAVGHAPLEILTAFKARMDWKFKFVSSANTDFNYDYGVSFTPEQVAGKASYNYREIEPAAELPGLSVFFKDEAGDIFHTYSTYSRGLDMLNGTYHMLDVVPKGRDEAGLPAPMAWLRLHDSYED